MNHPDDRSGDLPGAPFVQSGQQFSPSGMIDRLKRDAAATRGLVAYIDALFVSGNDVAVTSTLFSKASWDIMKECIAEGLPLDYHVVESEAVYRRKLAAYGEDTRAESPLKKLRESRAAA